MTPGGFSHALRLTIVVGALLLALAAAGQQDTKRTILGQVMDENDKAVENAIVRLKNLATRDEWSMVTDKKGRYQFSEVSMKADHEIYAEQGQRRSRTRTISQFDTRTEVVLHLKLEPPKKPAEEKPRAGGGR